MINATLRPIYALYRKPSEQQGRFGRVQEMLPPPGTDPRSVQPVASTRNANSYTATNSENNEYGLGVQMN